ncbi:MAG: hydroxyacylglutathione hydrolase [Solirubrobacteraceae bacterium]|nr:hydroxyacylglutathione hydrolase [Solirubrobacteraceae bacterium]
MLDVHGFTVGPVQENCYIVGPAGSTHAVVIDPGEEAPRLISAIERLGVSIDAILLTHTHFDHIGAVAPLAGHTHAPVWCPELERHVLADIDAYVPWPGFGPFESYQADHLIAGGETLQLAGLEIDVIFTPGHSPGHLTFAIGPEHALFAGDVLFHRSIGRTDLPGGDLAVLLDSIALLLDRYPDQATVYPGHMGLTTLGAERAHNPFLRELA